MSVLFCHLSIVFSVHLLQNEGGFDGCAYLAFSFSPVSQSEKGVVLTCVCTWLPSVMSFYSSLGSKEVVLTYVCTWFPSVSCLFFNFSQGG